MADKEKKKKESIFDLSKYIDKPIRVKFQGGREASGVLKGFDPLLNLVLDGTIEYMRALSFTQTSHLCSAEPYPIINLNYPLDPATEGRTRGNTL
uniref:LSM7 homolog, U6 small nuclear RNA and mRNA degradation associated n=1 Tax=Seriola dumerili TaxID=41447 RepID=A0A3B4T8I3_SERDU